MYYGGKTYLGFVAPTKQAVYALAYPGQAPMLPYVVHDFPAWYGTDDHANPVFLFREDGTCLAVTCYHGAYEIWVRKAVNVDNGIWAAEVDITSQLGAGQFSYPRIFQLTGEAGHPIWLFYRAITVGHAGIEGVHFSKSFDGGDTWASDTELIANGTYRPYHILEQNGANRIDIAINDAHPGLLATNCTYHGYIQSGNLYKSDGTLVGALNAGPYLPSDLTKVHDGAVDNRSWIWDIAIDSSGYPVLVYAVFPAVDDHRYYYARWNGAAWSEHQITTAGGTICPGMGEDYYSGGIAIDRNDQNTVYLSRQISGVHEIYKYVTTNSGTTWASTAITTSSTSGNYRPVCPKNASTLSPMFYMSGTYIAYTTFSTVIKKYTP